MSESYHDPLTIPLLPRRSMFQRMVFRLMPFRKPEDRTVPARLDRGNLFYGWFDQDQAEPTYDPPRDAPCPYCGKRLHPTDIRTHNIMWSGPIYADRSYFYRTHASCDDMGYCKGLITDGWVWDMIERNGD